MEQAATAFSPVATAGRLPDQLIRLLVQVRIQLPGTFRAEAVRELRLRVLPDIFLDLVPVTTIIANPLA